jgi:hypothetical protein
MTAAVDEAPVSYAAVHRYNGAVLQHDRRDAIVPMAIQPRDFALVRDVWRYKFLTAPMIHELWWGGESLWPAQRRLHKVFDAGLLERFRPISLRGSYPWTYHLGERGHAMLRDSGVCEIGWRYRPRVIHEFGHVLHELQLNAWVLAYRRRLGEAFVSWTGETLIEPERKTPEQQRAAVMQLDSDDTVHGLRDERERPVCPDAVVEVAGEPGDAPFKVLVEFDRTRRLDKNFEKFRRYDTFLTWWWNRSSEALDGPEPFVLFVCQDEEHQAHFLGAADFELTGCQMPYWSEPGRERYVGRERIIFAVEGDAHAGELVAKRVPKWPRTHPLREQAPDVRTLLMTYSAR